MNRPSLFLVALLGLASCSFISSTVNVTGEGTVLGTPDLATFTITITEQGRTSSEANDLAASKTNRALAILYLNGVAKSDIQTTRLSVSPVYRTVDGRQVVDAQEASQTLTVKLRNLKDGDLIGRLVDALKRINGIDIGNMDYEIENKAPLQEEARRKAFDNAKAKAEQLTQGRVLGDVVSITESSPQFNLNRSLSFAYGYLQSTRVNLGQLEVTVQVTVVWRVW